MAPPELPAYGRILLDVLEGNATLSIRADEAEEAWRVVAPVLSAWSKDLCPDAGVPGGAFPGPGCLGRITTMTADAPCRERNLRFPRLGSRSSKKGSDLVVLGRVAVDALYSATGEALPGSAGTKVLSGRAALGPRQHRC